jgi:hypothetical protein
MEIISGLYAKGETRISVQMVYSIDIDGNNMKKLIENGSHPSFSNVKYNVLQNINR